MWRFSLALLVLLPIQAHATEYVLMGMGADSCGNFASQYRLSASVAETSYFAWAQGYMSGLNTMISAAGKTAPRDLNGLAVANQEARIRSYCDQHPLGNYVDAVMDLYGALPFMRGNPWGK
jgi:hypothetical protein